CLDRGSSVVRIGSTSMTPTRPRVSDRNPAAGCGTGTSPPRRFGRWSTASATEQEASRLPALRGGGSSPNPRMAAEALGDVRPARPLLAVPGVAPHGRPRPLHLLLGSAGYRRAGYP